MNPNNTLANRFASYAKQYLDMRTGETKAIKNESNDTAFTVKRLSEDDKVTSLDYVDRYWQAANASYLTQAFDSIVDEIVIQSRYYSTLVTNNNYQQDGFISFTDEIGTGMEVKDIKGIYIGEGKLVTGGMFAEFIATGKVEDYDNTNYKDKELDGFENEILSAIEERFGISSSEAALLIESAKDNKFISYTSKTEFSNYIAWYANEDNEYIAPYTDLENHSTDEAKYIVRSYFYMGDVTQNHVETSMLYALVRVREDIETGRQIVDMNVPAALLPMVTYTITVNGDKLTQENVNSMTCEQKKPISLLFEVGLDSELTPINLEEKMEGQDFRKDQNGVYTFYTNRWRDNNGKKFTIPNDPDPHVFNHGIMNTTVTQFIPSLENERYYYTENIQILDSNHNIYTGSKPSGDGYYVEYRWIEGDGNSASLKTAYNPISSSVFEIKDAIIQIKGKDGWFIKKGTPQFYFGEEVHGEQAHSHKTDNKTNTLGWADYPHVAHHEDEAHTGYHMLNYLGNNGLVKVTPAQGIKLTKTVSTEVEGASDSFEFKIELRGTTLDDSYPLYIEHADSTVENKTVKVDKGVISLTLKAGDIVYITNLPVGTKYTVSEEYNSHYIASSTNASGTIKQYTLSDVDFVNSPKGYGSLLVEKDVTHPFDTISTEIENKEFNITVTFEGTVEELAEIEAPKGAKTQDQGITYTMKLKDGFDALFTNIPEGVKYSVTENNIPTGFKLITDAKELKGTISNNIQAQALLVNKYEPESVSPKITISGEKNLNGRTWDSSKDKYQVALQEVTVGGQGTVVTGSPIIVDVVKKDKADYTIDMSSIDYDNVGTYNYVVYEVFPSDEKNRVEDISYDTSIAMFTVTVTDKGTGKLIVENVVVYQNSATINGDAEKGWTIEKDFTNNYMADTISFPVTKKVVDEDDINKEITGHSGGIVIGLYNSVTDENPVYSTITDEIGYSNFILTVKQSEYSVEKYLYLREVIPLTNSQVAGMTYDTEFKYVIGIDWSDDTADEPIVKYYKYSKSATNGLGEEITDINIEPLEVINTFDKDIESNALTFSGKKTVNGGELRKGDSFTFELYETNATFNIAGLNPIQTKTVSNANGKYEFNPISFDSVGTKYLVVVEKQGKAGGINYDSTIYHITIDVSKKLDGNKTSLEAKTTHIHKVGIGDVKADEIDFNNIYRINDTESVVIEGNKTLTGRSLVEGEFTFGIFEEGSDKPLYTTTNGYDGSFTFPAINYKVVDEENFSKTYKYVIKELIPNDKDKKGIEHSTEKYTVVVNLKDDGKGGISKTVTINDKDIKDVKLEFKNKYSATQTTLTFGGTKYLENKDRGTYTINLYETGKDFAIKDINNPIESANVNVLNGSGKYSISLKYPLAEKGYHYYVLEELVPEDTKGVQYDSTKYYITVNAIDNGHGEMEAHIVDIICPYYEDDFKATELNFTNKYFTEPTEYVIKGTKVLENKKLEADMFEFCLSNSDGEIARVKNNKDGSFSFPAQIFDTKGVHTFYVSEINGGNIEKGITYDSAIYIIEVPVYDDEEGNLKVDIENIAIKKSANNVSEEVSEIIFNNKYNAESSDGIYIDGMKYLKGRDLLNGEFEFELYNADKEFTKGNLIATTKNQADGTFRFDKGLTYNKEGKYYYIVSEKNLGTEYVTFDDTTYGVIVTVIDNDEGKFVVSDIEIVIINDGSTKNVEDISFNNIFKFIPEDVGPILEIEPKPESDFKQEIELEPKPEKVEMDNPLTGDNFNIYLWCTVQVISAGGVMCTTLYSRKKKKK